MWSNGTITIGTKTAEYWVKHYEEGSEEYGINGGRISKLEVRLDNERIINYDRGWDKKPATKFAKTVFAELVAKFN